MYGPRTRLAVGIMAALVIGLVIGYAASLPSIVDLERRISEVEAQVANLQDDIDDRNTVIANLQSQIAQKESQISVLQSEVQNKGTQIEDLQSQMSGLERQVETKDNQISALQSEISDLEQQIESEVVGIYFSPKGGCEDEVLRWIDRANVSIHILIYSFTLDSIGDALVDAYERGILIQVVFEELQISQYSEYQKLKDAGITVRNDTNPDLMHDKVMIVDGIIVLTGSFNWSNNGESNNNENLIVIESTYVATVYEEEFAKIWGQSQPSDGNGGNGEPTGTNIVIEYVHYDAAGNDWDNLNDEYVVIRNTGTSDVNLAGWKLKDEVDHTYAFPSFTLKAGHMVTVYTGSGTNTQSSLYWGSGSPIWNNDGDTAYLYSQTTELMDKYSW